MDKDLEKHIKFVEETHNVRVIYLTKFGSQLHGTTTPASDTDYFGLFVPSIEDVLLKRDLDHFKRETSKDRNTSDDIDFELHSVYKFLNNVAKGETGALDLLFSMFRPDTQIICKPSVFLIKENYRDLLSKNINKFVGYCIAQAKKYGVKGSRYKELEDFNRKLIYLKCNHIKEKWTELEELIVKMDYKFIHTLTKTEPMGESTYVSVLGKLYQNTLTTEEFTKKIASNLSQYGERAKASTEGTDWKAMSHALRIIEEAEELLTTGFIRFPRPKAEYYRSIKLGEINIDEVTEKIDVAIDTSNNLFESTELPEKPSQNALDKLLLAIVNNKVSSITRL